VSKKWRLILGAAFLGLVAYRTDWNHVKEAFEGLDVRFWLAALFLQLGTQIISTWRWRMFALSSGLGGTFRNYLSFYFVGMFFNLILPTSVGGDVVRGWYLTHRDGSGHGRRMPAFLSVLADRISGVILLVLVACVAAIFCPVKLPPMIVAIVTAVGASAAAGVLGLPVLRRLLHSRRFAAHRFERLRRIADGGMAYMCNVPLTLKTTLLSLVVQVNSVIIMALIGVGLGLEVPALYYGILMPLVTLLTLLPVSVNGVGLREWSTIQLLEPIHVDSAKAITLAFLLFAAQTVAGLVGLIPYLAGGLQRFDAAAAAKESTEEDEDEDGESNTAAA
jgi:glycosyltransferase 2 family protein